MERIATEAVPAARSARPATGSMFVGRHWERTRTQATLDASLGGHGGLIVISGEAGIGKSTLASWIASRAEHRGAEVAWGRCWESGGAPPYWPWMQALRGLIDRSGPEAAMALVGDARERLAQLLPELAPTVPARPPRAETQDPDAVRFRMFEAVGAYLRQAAEHRPIVVIVDDLHVADLPSLLLLDFLVADLAAAPILLVGAHRNEENEKNEVTSDKRRLDAALAGLARHPTAQPIRLGTLSADEVDEYVALTLGQADHDLSGRVFDASDGNPLFVRELVQLLAAERTAPQPGSPPGTVPRGARAVIEERLARLSPETRELLEVAAVLGREFAVEMLARLTDVGPGRLLQLLDPAVRKHIVLEVPDAAGRLRFSHALVRDAIYERIRLAERARLHARAGEALAPLHAHAVGGAAEVAHHLFLAGPLADPSKAIEFARRAGEDALRSLAYEEAVLHFQSALQAASPADAPRSERERCQLLLAIGDAAARAGDEPRAKRAFFDATRIAREHRYAQELAAAALGYGGRFLWARAGRDRRLISLLRQALAELDPADSSLRVRLLARLAGALRDDVDVAPRQAASRDALDMARRLGDPDALTNALDGRCAALLLADNAAERLALTEELIRVAEDHDLGERAFQGHYYRTLTLMELGRIEEMRRELDVAEATADQLRQAPQLWLARVTRASLALFEGRFAAAVGLIEDARLLGERAQTGDAVLSHRLQRYLWAREQGTLPEIEAELRQAVVDYPARPMLRAALAHTLAEIGQSAEAGQLVRDLAADPRRNLASNPEWPMTLGMLAEAATLLGDRKAAGSLYEALRPLAGLNAATSDEGAIGSVERYLGLLAMALGDRQAAVAHLEEAVEGNLRMGAGGWAAHSQHELAAALVARGEDGDVERAAALLKEAATSAGQFGMAALERSARALLERVRPEADEAEESGRAAGGRLLFRREGDYWTIAFGEDLCRLRHTIGLSHLARLLAAPGQEFHAVDLAQAATTGETATLPETAAEPLLDGQARTAYRDRLADLEEEIAEAEGYADGERAARLGAEREALVAELSRATGLFGRDRPLARASERARVSVTRAIRSAIARIGERDPRLAQHLRATVRTGTFCAYMPDPRVPADWEI